MTLIFHACGEHPLVRWTFVLSDPVEVFLAAPGQGAEIFMRARRWVAARRAETGPAPFSGGVAGLIAYESACLFDVAPRLDPADGAPGFALGAYDRVAAYDHQAKRAFVVAQSEERATDLARSLQELTPEGSTARAQQGVVAPCAPVDRFRAMTARTIARVRRGELYQANISRRYEGALGAEDHPYGLFDRLCTLSPAPFCAYMRLENAALVSNSPELFMATKPSAGGLIASTRPIKGTRARGAARAEDAALARALQASAKDRAENLMIVDLMRNDLARMCAPGSVCVPRLFDVESFANVHHLVSEVVGRVLPGRTAFDVFAAAFPPGSVTGAPKIKAMQIIAEEEAVGRGAYCGSLAWFGFDGAMEASVLIRTVLCRPQGSRWRVDFGVGAGIVADSDPAEEARETQHKAASLVRAIRGRAGLTGAI